MLKLISNVILCIWVIRSFSNWSFFCLGIKYDQIYISKDVFSLQQNTRIIVVMLCVCVCMCTNIGVLEYKHRCIYQPIFSTPHHPTTTTLPYMWMSFLFHTVLLNVAKKKYAILGWTIVKNLSENTNMKHDFKVNIYNISFNKIELL